MRKGLLFVLFTAFALALGSCGALAPYELPENDVRQLNSMSRNYLRDCNDIMLLADAQLNAGIVPKRRWLEVNADVCIDLFQRVVKLAEDLEYKAVHPKHRDSLRNTINLFRKEILMWEMLKSCSVRGGTPETIHRCFREAYRLFLTK